MKVRSLYIFDLYFVGRLELVETTKLSRIEDISKLRIEDLGDVKLKKIVVRIKEERKEKERELREGKVKSSVRIDS